jgi:small nuclear ribonucleoprotein (snRNP)-like protein
MAEWLVVAGISIVIMTTLGLIRQAGFRGHGAVFFLLPLAGLRQVREHWETYGRLALLRVLGWVCILAGLALIQSGRLPISRVVVGQTLSGAMSTSPSAFVGSQQAALLMVRGEGQPLSGRIHGHDLRQPRVSLINGVLSISQGDGFLAGLSVSIMLDWPEEWITERRALLINPIDDSGPDIHLSWRPEGHSYPETRIFHNGYRLDLVLAPLDHHQLTGTLQLLLPDRRQSYLVGNFTAYTNHLRFLNGKVNLSFDHPDTLGYVAEQYLHTQYAVGEIAALEIENVNLRRIEREGEVQARVTLRDGTVERQRMTLEKSSVGWSVTPGSLHTEVRGGAAATAPATPPAATTQHTRPTPSPARPGRLSDLASYVNRIVTVTETGGQQTRGRLARVSGDRLWLEIRIGSGSADLQLDASQIAELMLDDGTRLRFAPNRAVVPASTPTVPPAEAGPDSHPPFQALVGRRVTVTLADGGGRTGILRTVAEDHVALAVPMGAGSVEYLFDLDDIASVTAVR